MEGSDVSPFYDPLLGKLIVHGGDRPAAIARMARALAELRILGVETSTAFHERVMREEDFRAGAIDIRYVDAHPALLRGGGDDDNVRYAALAATLLEEERRARRAVRRIGGDGTAAAGWRAVGWRA
jgi:acetyl/propionyl-CoA carboxylase alpha subunit